MAAYNRQTKTVESIPVGRLKGFETRRIAVVGRDHFARAFDFKMDAVESVKSRFWSPFPVEEQGVLERLSEISVILLFDAMTQDEVLQVFRDTGALLEGHFILRSGLHSRQFFQCALALQQMPTVEKLGGALANKVRHLGVATVVSPAMGGLVLGQEVARQLGVRFIFVEKEDGKLVLRRGFRIASGEKILVVEDVITKGGRVQETLDIVRAHQGKAVGIAMAVDRSGGQVQFGLPTFHLIALSVETFDPQNLPRDLAAIPAVKPGSK